MGWLLKLEHSESNRHVETNSVANREPMQIRMDRCGVANSSGQATVTNALMSLFTKQFELVPGGNIAAGGNIDAI